MRCIPSCPAPQATTRWVWRRPTWTSPTRRNPATSWTAPDRGRHQCCDLRPPGWDRPARDGRPGSWLPWRRERPDGALLPVGRPSSRPHPACRLHSPVGLRQFPRPTGPLHRTGSRFRPKAEDASRFPLGPDPFRPPGLPRSDHSLPSEQRELVRHALLRLHLRRSPSGLFPRTRKFGPYRPASARYQGRPATDRSTGGQWYFFRSMV